VQRKNCAFFRKEKGIQKRKKPERRDTNAFLREGSAGKEGNWGGGGAGGGGNPTRREEGGPDPSFCSLRGVVHLPLRKKKPGLGGRERRISVLKGRVGEIGK